MSGWQLWGVPLLLIVWASLRRGLGGGLTTATVVTAICATVASSLAWPEHRQLLLQGNLLAQCSTALLVGVSAHWIRSGEARYRQVVGNIPVVLYSARILRPAVGGRAPEAEITFVSPASREVLGCEPGRLIGDFATWLD